MVKSSQKHPTDHREADCHDDQRGVDIEQGRTRGKAPEHVGHAWALDSVPKLVLTVEEIAVRRSLGGRM